MVNFIESNETMSSESSRAILAGLQRREEISRSMEELSGLAEAAGAEVLGEIVQKVERPNPATQIGKGKIEELKELCCNMEANLIIFNEELSGVQIRNLEDQLGVRVIDRTVLILDIFAARATSREGKLQVELAQLQYRLPRLTGFGKSLSRLGAGIGTRGPGEKKLETDRRHVAKRMSDIKVELSQLKTTRATQRTKREKSNIPVVALVGYTNSGKSALMNKLLVMTQQEEKVVAEQDMLFSTLDTRHRNIKLDNKREFILIDTVGFVSKLPHVLIQAFKATLEEVLYADLLLHVVDSAYEHYDFQINTTDRVLKEIGAAATDKIIVYNKIDLMQTLPIDAGGGENISISAKRGDNVELLIQKIQSYIFADRFRCTLLIPFQKGDISSWLYEKAVINSMEYQDEGTLFDVELSATDYHRLKEYDTVQNN